LKTLSGRPSPLISTSDTNPSDCELALPRVPPTVLVLSYIKSQTPIVVAMLLPLLFDFVALSAEALPLKPGSEFSMSAVMLSLSGLQF
jgi:hypothetical protein